MPPKKGPKKSGGKRSRASSALRDVEPPSNGAGREELFAYIKAIGFEQVKGALLAVNEHRPDDPAVYLAEHLRRRMPPGNAPLEAPWTGPEDDLADLQKTQVKAYLEGSVMEPLKAALVEVLRNRVILSAKVDTAMIDVIADFIAPPPEIKHIDGAVAAEAEVHDGDEESLAFKLDAVTTHVVSKIVELAAGFQASCGGASVLPLPRPDDPAPDAEADVAAAASEVVTALEVLEGQICISIEAAGNQALGAIADFRKGRGPLNNDDKLEVAGALAGMNLEVDRALDDVNSAVDSFSSGLRRNLAARSAVAEVEGGEAIPVPEAALTRHGEMVAEKLEELRASAVGEVHSSTGRVNASVSDIGADVGATVYFDAMAMARRWAAEGAAPGFTAQQLSMAGDIVRGSLARARDIVVAAVSDGASTGSSEVGTSAFRCLAVTHAFVHSSLHDIRGLAHPGTGAAMAALGDALAADLTAVEGDVAAAVAEAPETYGPLAAAAAPLGPGDAIQRQIEVRGALDLEIKMARQSGALARILGDIGQSLKAALAEADEDARAQLVFGCLPPLRAAADEALHAAKAAARAGGAQAAVVAESLGKFRELALLSLERLGQEAARAGKAAGAGGEPAAPMVRSCLTEVGEVVQELVNEWQAKGGAPEGLRVGTEELVACYIPVPGGDLVDITAIDEAAVIKVQANVRGYQSRKVVSKMKAEALQAALEEREGLEEGDLDAFNATKGFGAPGGADVGTETALGLYSGEDEAAVIRMQAAARGHQARKQVKAMRA